MQQVVALVDCANFYCSCERVFAPALQAVPVAVLSNNDGCIIARSEEVKALGIPMGAPYFKHREQLERARVRLFSSNYTLYADMSRRVMEVLGTFVPDVEVYSIDEAFLGLEPSSRGALMALGRSIRARVGRWTGIPVRIGLGRTKTLAKVALEAAKKTPDQVFSLVDAPEIDRVLEALPVGEVWGIGRSYRRLLASRGVHTARALRDLPDAWVRRHMHVVGLRTVWELRGTPCLPLDLLPPTRKGITRSRSFGKQVTTLVELQQGIASYMSRAAEKLRQYGLDATTVQVFITTKNYGQGPHYTGATGGRLEAATHHTPTLIKAALKCLGRIYRPGFGYRKAGVILSNLVPHVPEQGHLFLTRNPDDENLMAVLDAVNSRYGAGTLFVARCGVRRCWAMQRQHTSPCYTTRWSDLPLVKAA